MYNEEISTEITRLDTAYDKAIADAIKQNQIESKKYGVQQYYSIGVDSKTTVKNT